LAPDHSLPEVPGLLSAAHVAQTIDAIASVQLDDGNIPWVPGGHTDPWNLVEAAMALDVGGRFAEAERAYEWLTRMQHASGSWHAYYVGNEIKEHTLDTNVTCYVANGVWHHYLCTRDAGFLETMFPVVERAIDFALDHQHPTGEIEWDADPQRVDGKGALLTGSSSIYSSLRCAIAAAECLDRDRPDWELSLGSLAIAIAQTLGPSIENVILALSVTYWPWFTRLVHAEVRSLKNEVFIEAASALGVPTWRVILLHVLPNVLSPIIVRASIGMGFTILTASALGFLGLGAPPPAPEWGRMISESREFLPEAWWSALAPGLAIFLVVMGFNLLGDGLRDILDPRIRRARR